LSSDRHELSEIFKLSIKMESKHIQHNFLMLADEFLLQYLHCRNANRVLITSRLFSMSHALELYSKAALLNIKEYSDLETSHKIHDFLKELNPDLALRDEVIEAGKNLFSHETTNFDIGTYQRYGEELEVYLAIEYAKDLKYLVTKKGDQLFPVTVSTTHYNKFFLSIVKKLRQLIQCDEKARITENLLPKLKGLQVESDIISEII